MKTQERTNDKNNDEGIKKIKCEQRYGIKKREEKKTALSKMNRELFEVHVRNAIQLEHKQQHNGQTNERAARLSHY